MRFAMAAATRMARTSRAPNRSATIPPVQPPTQRRWPGLKSRNFFRSRNRLRFSKAPMHATRAIRGAADRKIAA